MFTSHLWLVLTTFLETVLTQGSFRSLKRLVTWSLNVLASMSPSWFHCSKPERNVSTFRKKFAAGEISSDGINWTKLQDALSICGFDFWRIYFCILNIVIWGFSLDYPRFFIEIATNKQLFGHSNAPMLSAVLVFAGHSQTVTPANNEGRLYYPNMLHENSN